jgi:hypothetical protein
LKKLKKWGVENNERENNERETKQKVEERRNVFCIDQ